MEIKFSNHSKLQMTARGANENEVIQAIEEGNWQRAKENKFQCSKKFLYQDFSPVNKQYYQFKTVNSIFVNENSEIIVVTVKVYYFNE